MLKQIFSHRSFLIAGCVLLLYWVLLAVSTHLPPHTPILHLVEGLWDKFLHFTAFFCLAILISTVWAVQRQSRYSGPKTAHIWRFRLTRFFNQSIPFINYAVVWTTVVAYGSIDEPTQPLFGRDCDYYDLLADTIGCTSGLLMFACGMYLGRRFFRRESVT